MWVVGNEKNKLFDENWWIYDSSERYRRDKSQKMSCVEFYEKRSCLDIFGAILDHHKEKTRAKTMIGAEERKFWKTCKTFVWNNHIDSIAISAHKLAISIFREILYLFPKSCFLFSKKNYLRKYHKMTLYWKWLWKIGLHHSLLGLKAL